MADVIYKARESGIYTAVAVDTDNIYTDSLPTQGVVVTLPSYAISYVLLGIGVDGDCPTEIESTASFKLKARNGYLLPETISVTNADFTYNNQTGDVSLTSPTADIVVTAIGIQTARAVKLDISNNKRKKKYGFFL